MDDAYPFAISLALGLLVGIERERKVLRPDTQRAHLPGGIRTFPLIALFGCLTAALAAKLGPAVFVVGLAGFSLLVVAVYVMTSLAGDLGMTTEVTILSVYLLGALVHAGHPVLASGLAVAITVLLHARETLHDLALRVAPEDLYATLTLAVVTLIVLPVLPDRNMGPYGVWNPFKIWLLVVFISAIGFTGYIAMKLLGPGRGIALAGLLGGLVSSTATTLTFAGKSREAPALSGAAALAVSLAWAVMFGRLIAEVAVIDAALALRVAPVLIASGLAGAAGAAVVAVRGFSRSAGDSDVAYSNPFRLSSAMKFGALFAAVLLLAKLAQVRYADAGLLLAALVSGLADADAAALTAARLAHDGQVGHETAALAVYLSAGANTVAKAALAVGIGAPPLRRSLSLIAALTLGAGATAAYLL